MIIKRVPSEIGTGENPHSVILDDSEMRLFGNNAYRDFILKENYNKNKTNPYLSNEGRIKMESRYNHGAIKGGIGGNTGASKAAIANFLEEGGKAKTVFTNGVNRDALSQAQVIHDYRANNHQVAPEKSLRERLEQRREDVRKWREQKKAKTSTPATTNAPTVPTQVNPKVPQIVPNNPVVKINPSTAPAITNATKSGSKLVTNGLLKKAGIGALAVGTAAGIGYGAKKLYDKKKKEE